jgi:hypothetical protein
MKKKPFKTVDINSSLIPALSEDNLFQILDGESQLIEKLTEIEANPYTLYFSVLSVRDLNNLLTNKNIVKAFDNLIVYVYLENDNLVELKPRPINFHINIIIDKETALEVISFHASRKNYVLTPKN